MYIIPLLQFHLTLFPEFKLYSFFAHPRSNGRIGQTSLLIFSRKEMQFVSHWKMNVGDKMQIFFTSSSFFMSFIGFAMMPLLFSCAHIVLFLCDMVVASFSLRPPYGENELSNQGRRRNLHVCGQLMFTSHGSVLRSATCSYIVSSLLGIHLVKSWIMPRFCFLYQNIEIFAP